MSQNEELSYPAYPIGWITEDHLTDSSATTYDKDTADRWNKKGWPVRPIYDGSALAALSAYSEQLRAQVAGLRTGYEAYEQVNAELKAKNETLVAAGQALRDEWRKDQADAERYRWLLQNWFTMSSEYMGGVSFQTGRSRWSDLPDEAVSEAIDAALGQGEQS